MFRFVVLPCFDLCRSNSSHVGLTVSMTIHMQRIGYTETIKKRHPQKMKQEKTSTENETRKDIHRK